MRTYVISYDLAKPHRNQHVVAQTIMALGDKWARPLANTWYVVSDRDEAELEADLRSFLDEEDGLIIQATKRDAMLTNTSLRWFRQRRTEIDVSRSANVVAFPTQTSTEPVEPELPFAEAC